MKTESGFSYIIRISIGPKNITIIVRNIKEVPQSFLQTLAKEKIEKEINLMYQKTKHAQVYFNDKTVEHFFNSMIKKSDFEIEDLNHCEVYDLNINFNNETIINSVNEKQKTEIRQSTINKFSIEQS